MLLCLASVNSVQLTERRNFMHRQFARPTAPLCSRSIHRKSCYVQLFSKISDSRVIPGQDDSMLTFMEKAAVYVGDNEHEICSDKKFGFFFCEYTTESCKPPPSFEMHETSV